MTKKNDTLVMALAFLIIGLAFLVTAGILGGAYLWFLQQSGGNLANLPSGNSTPTPTPPPSPENGSIFTFPATVPPGTTIKINGSTSMVLINQGLKYSFENQFPGTKVITDARGTNKGIPALLGGNIDVAAIARPLTAQEQGQGLTAIAVAQDAIAIVIGLQNLLPKGLTQEQVVGIFQGKITNWSQLGRWPGTIQVINRSQNSGTRQIFREFVLKGEQFGNTPNIRTVERDATTPILQQLGIDGISYATYPQVAHQQTVRTVTINGLTPEDPNYPYQRPLFYAYQNPPSEAVKAFLGYTTSPIGQQVIQKAESTSPLKTPGFDESEFDESQLNGV